MVLADTSNLIYHGEGFDQRDYNTNTRSCKKIPLDRGLPSEIIESLENNWHEMIQQRKMIRLVVPDREDVYFILSP